MLLRHFCRFFGNNVAGFGHNVAGFSNNMEGNFVLSTKSQQIEHVQFVSTLLKGRNFTINSFDTAVVFGRKVERCFDIVAGVDGALLTTRWTDMTSRSTA